jgi:hypothetical protein
MNQKELAALLGVTPAIVSRHAKRGMPTDTLERAERWRKRHLEPGRVKGSRADTLKPRQPSPPAQAKPAPVALGATVADFEAVGDLIDGALNRGNQDAAASRVRQFRLMLRQSHTPAADESIRLTARAWVALLDLFIHQESEIRHTPNKGVYLTAGECGKRMGGAGHGWPARMVLFECCDFDDISIHGWPDYGPDPED